jgi:hypothetical protein
MPCRASLRCGTGLFVTDNLLQPGPFTLSVVSLNNSLAGMAMKQGEPVSIDLASKKWVLELSLFVQVVYVVLAWLYEHCLFFWSFFLGGGVARVAGLALQVSH